MARAWDKEKLWVPDRSRTHDLPNTGRTLHPLSYANSWSSYLTSLSIFFFPTGFPCKICPPGSYNNVTRAETCYCCRPGYSSTYMKTSCRACPANEYADQGDFPDCTLCRTCFVKASCKLHEMLEKTLHYDSYICFCWQYNLHGGRVAFFLTLLF